VQPFYYLWSNAKVMAFNFCCSTPTNYMV